jgi:hypothetical protein
MSKRFLNSALATSGVVQKVVPQEVKELLVSLKKVNEKILGKEGAKKLDTNMVRIALKMKGKSFSFFSFSHVSSHSPSLTLPSSLFPLHLLHLASKQTTTNDQQC